MFDQHARHVENVIDDNQPEGHVYNVIVDQPDASDFDQHETFDSRDVDSLVHVVRLRTPMHADTKFEPHQESSVLSRRSLLGSAGTGPFTTEERHAVKAKTMLVQGVTHPTPDKMNLLLWPWLLLVEKVMRNPLRSIGVNGVSVSRCACTR